MVDTTSRPATADPTGAAPTGARQIRRRRSLPGSRAVVGGLLVAAAAVGAFGTYAAASDGPSDSVVVLTRDVGPGERLDAEDLAVVVEMRADRGDVGAGRLAQRPARADPDDVRAHRGASRYTRPPSDAT